MKILRVRRVGSKDGQPLFRVKVQCADGQRHRLLARSSDLSHPLMFNRLAQQRLGKKLVADTMPAGELTAAVSHALVRTGPPHAAFEDGRVWPAGHRDRETGLPLTTGVSARSLAMQALRQLLDRLGKVLATPGEDPIGDASDALADALAELDKLDDEGDE